MLGDLETPRPLPPAKARRVSAMRHQLKTPPPAYGSPFTFPARRQGRQDILGSPMSTTFQMVGWCQEDSFVESDSTAPESQEWANERSREELKNLLLKADEIIKERENELGITTAVCKGLYQNNVALKSKHQALLARLPMSPARSTSSPGNLFHHSSPRESSISLTASSSDSALGLIRSPLPSVRHARKVSIATADISLLEDQNAELLDKLEKLEQESTTTDLAGRRELKRLENEISFLREALEKTQARSEELEEKVEGAMVSQARRRKKEREAKFKTMRTLSRNSPGNEVPNFAPDGSRFGGPTETFSFFPTAESPDPNRRLSSSSSVETDLNLPSSLAPPEHSLIAQLLTKVKELEETNTRILQQQSDTASQLSAVQRDTAHITKVYECLSDPEFGELELLQDEVDEQAAIKSGPASSGHTIRFLSLKRNIEKELPPDGTCIVHPEFLTSGGKNRKTVMGLFDECPEEDAVRSSNDDLSPDDRLRAQLSFASWSEGHNRSTWSSVSSIGVASHSASLSPLHFFSPPSQIRAELSPIGARPTLQHELDREFGNGTSWEAASDPYQGHLHLRTSSLYDMSQFSVPPSPSPPSRATSRRGSDELDFEAIRRVDSTVDGATAPRGQPPGLLMPMNSLQLSVEPPTPEKRRSSNVAESNHDNDNVSIADSGISITSSPRVKMISEVLKSRTHRWGADRRLRHRKRSRSRETQAALASLCELNFNSRDGSSSAGTSPTRESIPRRLMNAVDGMIDGFAENQAASRAFGTLDDKDQDNFHDGDAPGHHTAEESVTPRARSRRPHARRSSSLTEEEVKMQLQLHGAPPSMKTDVDASHGGLLFQVWLWIQFAIVVFVFLYAMARRGPAAVLGEGENKKGVVARRR